MMKQADRAQGAETEAFPAYTRIDGAKDSGWLILCDHASNALPEEYGTLGLPPAQLERHIGYDIGAAGIARELARLLNAPAVLANFSRILIDPNRGEDDPTLIMRISDRAVVPGNAEVDGEERARRVSRFYAPYHRAIDDAIDEGLAAGTPPAIVSVHTFTEAWKGHPRPWHVSVLWDQDPRLPRPLIEGLKAEPGLVVGENVPYSGELKNDCLYRHGTKRGLAHALVEIRQDLVREEEGQREWAERLARVMASLDRRAEPDAALNAVCHYGSRADMNGAKEASGAGLQQ